MKCYLVDIDGTLADPAQRLHYISNEPKDWDAFFAACKDDVPIRHAFDLLHALAQDAQVLLVTGRPNRCRQDTEAWLTRNGAPVLPLFMRIDGDYRRDDVVKQELLRTILDLGYEPIMAFEDRARVVAMYRANGIPCAQVAEGNY